MLNVNEPFYSMSLKMKYITTLSAYLLVTLSRIYDAICLHGIKTGCRLLGEKKICWVSNSKDEPCIKYTG